ncbi:hypothetical protein [Phytopseudomonas daroniae]|uniref:hypothetical protein n=1 Tax=Phytopseudomonas daroniae TaxID=2487519 RepID=UPI00103857E2|nr:hypothetical protein [Pseudomonas daroniae]TBU78189.1 hypothetical protein DNK10_00120 [Pseudomonas daroniae]
MQTNPTPKWLELFITAFGAQGLVALAWWAGAYHAERIRNLQGTYPILQINGDAGSGKSTLVSNLWKLSGVTESELISPCSHTFGALLLRLAKAVNEPVVIDDVANPHESVRFDWDCLKQFYSSDNVLRSGPSERVKFRGALVIVGTGPNILKTRSVEVQLERAAPVAERSAAVQALYDLHITDLAEFLNKVQANAEMAGFCMGRADVLALTQSGLPLTDRDARNHAQLLGMLDFIDVLFNVPAEALAAAERKVREMAWHTVGRTRGPIED